MSASSIGDRFAGQPSLLAALAGLERAAQTDAPILLVGEAGTGRTTLARLIHAIRSIHADAPGVCVEVDPGAVPASLFESRLFGHLPGAFTGAGGGAAGWVERSESGTLVLDRIEELPLAIQPKLLRLLSERTYTPLGGAERRTTARFVAIGPEDLGRRVDAGAFRRDLFYRLEVFSFRLPPLRERRTDLPAIAAGLLRDLGARFERPDVRLSEPAVRWMTAHPWPGNLRQLRNVLERALLATPVGRVLDPEPEAGGASTPRSLAEVEAEEIRRALAHTRGHQGRAAELLGISRKALWEKRKRHGIP